MFTAAPRLSSAFELPCRWATKMQSGVAKNTKDSAGKRLGIKKFGGEPVGYNKILVRQRGFKWSPGYNVFVGKDHTIHSAAEGYVIHEYNTEKKRTVVSVVPHKLPEKPKFSIPFCYHPELFPELAKDNPAPSNLFRPKPKPEVKEKKVNKGTPLATPKYRETPIIETLHKAPAAS